MVDRIDYSDRRREEGPTEDHPTAIRGFKGLKPAPPTTAPKPRARKPAERYTPQVSKKRQQTIDDANLTPDELRIVKEARRIEQEAREMLESVTMDKIPGGATDSDSDHLDDEGNPRPKGAVMVHE